MIDTVAELTESYRLRYEVYAALGYLQRFNASRLEIDEYDSSSIPFGAFDPRTGAMVGTLRLITTEVQPEPAHLLRALIADRTDEALAEQASARRPRRLPSITSHDILRQIEAFNTGGFAVQELSRTIVRPGHRGAGVSRGLMELGLAHAARVAPVVLVGSCLPEHLSMYARYGYLALPDTGLAHFDSVGQIAHALVCRTDRLPQPTRAHCDDLMVSMRSGARECTLESHRGAVVRYRFAAASRRARWRAMEW